MPHLCLIHNASGGVSTSTNSRQSPALSILNSVGYTVLSPSSSEFDYCTPCTCPSDSKTEQVWYIIVRRGTPQSTKPIQICASYSVRATRPLPRLFLSHPVWPPTTSRSAVGSPHKRPPCSSSAAKHIKSSKGLLTMSAEMETPPRSIDPINSVTGD